jgi:hypothetical protein
MNRTAPAAPRGFFPDGIRAVPEPKNMRTMPTKGWSLEWLILPCGTDTTCVYKPKSGTRFYFRYGTRTYAGFVNYYKTVRGGVVCFDLRGADEAARQSAQLRSWGVSPR